MTNALTAVLLLASPLLAQTGESPLLVTINGAPVRRADVERKIWREHAEQGLNDLVDEILLRQESERVKAKADAAEVDVRLKRIRDQFKDEATFRERVKAAGGSVETLRANIEEQVRREALLVKAKGLRVTDAEVKEAFDANKDKLGVPEASRLRLLLVGSEKEAGDFLVALRAGADFAKLASQVSLDAGTKQGGGDMGFIPRGMLQPELEKLVFALKPGEISAPVKTAGGWALFQVSETRASKPAVFKDVQVALKQALLAEKIQKAWPGYLAELRSKAKVEPAAPR